MGGAYKGSKRGIIGQGIEKLTEGFERQEKENEKIWQAIEQNAKAIEEKEEVITWKS